MYKEQFTPFRPYNKVVTLNDTDAFVVKSYSKDGQLAAKTEDEFIAQSKLAFYIADQAIFKAMGA